MPTSEQKDYIEENYLYKTHAEIAKDLGISPVTVRVYCSKRGLKKTGKINDSKVKFILNNANKLSLKALAGATGSNVVTVHKIIKRAGIDKKRIRKPKQAQPQKWTQQLCWKCARAANTPEADESGRLWYICPWANKLKPVKGWTVIKVCGKEYITDCPLFKEEEAPRKIGGKKNELSVEKAN